MGKGERIRQSRTKKQAATSAQRDHDATAQIPLPLAPEYPSLVPLERSVMVLTELAASRRKHLNRMTPPPDPGARVTAAVGETGPYEFASSKLIDEWMRCWEMPAHARKPGTENIRTKTSSSVYVAITDQDDMPSSSAARAGSPAVSIPAPYVELCSRIADVFPMFSRLVHENRSAAEVGAARRAMFEYTDATTTTPAPTSRLIEYGADAIFTTRSTSAAVRWAIGHEMAHLLTTAKQRTAVYEKVDRLWPMLQQDQWDRLRGTLEPFGRTLYSYREEIACDLLANQYVLDSAFSTDDLITQASGALIALEALVWSGWNTDRSKLSPTHPSPTVRFLIIYLDWLAILADPATWQNRATPDLAGLQDFAFFFAFERWAAGVYSERRNGAQWRSDIEVMLTTSGTWPPPTGRRPTT